MSMQRTIFDVGVGTLARMLQAPNQKIDLYSCKLQELTIFGMRATAMNVAERVFRRHKAILVLIISPMFEKRGLRKRFLLWPKRVMIYLGLGGLGFLNKTCQIQLCRLGLILGVKFTKHIYILHFEIDLTYHSNKFNS